MCGQKGYPGKQCMLVNVVWLYDMKWNSDQWYTSTRLVWSSTGIMLSLSINVLMLILLRYSSFPKYYFRYVLSLKHSNMTFSWNLIVTNINWWYNCQHLTAGYCQVFISYRHWYLLLLTWNLFNISEDE